MIHKHVQRHITVYSCVNQDKSETEVVKTPKPNTDEIFAMNTKDDENSDKKSDGEVIDKEAEEMIEDPTKQYDVAFISADYSYGFFLNHLLKARCPSITTNFTLKSDAAQLACIDTARLIVPLLSQNFVQSGKDVDEYQISLARHRNNNGPPLLYPICIEELPRWPTYFHLVPCAIALHDTLWKEVLSSDIDAGPGTQV